MYKIKTMINSILNKIDQHKEVCLHIFLFYHFYIITQNNK